MAFEISYCFSPSSKDQQQDNKCWGQGVQGEGNPHSLLMELQTGGPTLEISLKNSQKAKNKSTT